MRGYLGFPEPLALVMAQADTAPHHLPSTWSTAATHLPHDPNLENDPTLTSPRLLTLRSQPDQRHLFPVPSRLPQGTQPQP